MSAPCNHGRTNPAYCLLCDNIEAEKGLLTALDFARTTGDRIALLLAYRAEGAAAERARIVASIAATMRNPEYTDGVCHVCGQYSSYCCCYAIDDALRSLRDQLTQGDA